MAKTTTMDVLARRVGKILPLLNLTLTTVSTVVLSKSWDVFLTSNLWQLYLGTPQTQPLTCEQNIYHFLLTLTLGGALLGWGVRFPGTEGKVFPAVVAMLVGWGFKGALTKCHGGMETRVVHALTANFDQATLDRLDLVSYEWSDEGELNFELLDFGFAILATVGAGLLMNVSQRIKNCKCVKSEDSKANSGLMETIMTLLSTSLGLGVAATWDIAFAELNSLDDYSLFRAGARHGGCVVHDLPSSFSLRFYW